VKRPIVKPYTEGIEGSCPDCLRSDKAMCLPHSAGVLEGMVEQGLIYEFIDNDGEVIYCLPYAGPAPWCTREEWEWLEAELDKEDS